MRINYGKFHKVVNYLKKNLPPEYPVSARRMYGLPKGTMADIELVEKDNKKKFVIRISRKLGNDISVLMLIHEWAHALVGKRWEDWEDRNSSDAYNGPSEHGEEWGVAYSRVYSCFESYLDQE
jgi:hypothetical protein